MYLIYQMSILKRIFRKKDNYITETEKELSIYNEDDLEWFSIKGQIHMAKVYKCYDGDTVYCIFKLEGRYHRFRIRMLGYDSPEKRPRGDLSDEERIAIKALAQKATDKISELILDKIVYVYCHDFDNFGRLLAEIKLNPDDDETVNQIMLDGGFGIPYE